MEQHSTIPRVMIGILLGVVLGFVLFETGNFKRFAAQVGTGPCPAGQLYIGFDAGGSATHVSRYDGSALADAGQLSNNVYSFAVLNNQLYAAVIDHVYRCDASGWTDLGTGDQGGGFIYAMAPFNGKLYVGKFGGHVDSFDISTGWTDLGRVDPNIAVVESVAVFNNELYAAGIDRVMKYGGSGWSVVGGPFGNVGSIKSLVVSGGQLYASVLHKVSGAADEGRVYQYVSGTSWADRGQVGSATLVRSLADFNGQLFAGADTPDGAHVYLFANGGTWTDTGKLPGPVNVLSDYNAVLYAGIQGTGGATVYRLSGGAWQDALTSGTQVYALAALPGSASQAAAISSLSGGYCCNTFTTQCTPAQ